PYPNQRTQRASRQGAPVPRRRAWTLTWRIEREPLEDRPQPIGADGEFLGQHARLADDGHEVRVAAPARDDVHVHMIQDARARGLPKVDPHVHSVRRVGFGQRDLRAPRQLHHFAQFVRRHGRERRDMPVGDDHQVTVVVGKQVKDDETAGTAEKDERSGVAVGEGGAENAVRGTTRAGDVGETPRTPQVIHVYAECRMPNAEYRSFSIQHFAFSILRQTPARSDEPVSAGGTVGAGASVSRLISSFSSFPALKYGTFFGGPSTLSLVFRFRPLRGSRRRRRQLPTPRNSIFSPRCS